MQKHYDDINMLDPNQIIAGHNGQDKYGKIQSVTALHIHRRLGRIELQDVFLSKGYRVFYPVEQLVEDQYENVYYMMHCVLADGEVHTYCDRVRTIEIKKNYELKYGWGEHVWRKYRDKGFEAILHQQKLILGGGAN